MLRLVIPLVLALLGLGAGIGAGLFLRPAAEEGALPAEEEHPAADPEAMPDYVKLNNQFVVPVLEGGRVASMVVMSLSLEVEKGKSEEVYAREPKLRDAFLQAMFDHANAGGFRGSFTDGSNLVMLRQALKEKAVGILGPMCSDVLITEIARQDS